MLRRSGKEELDVPVILEEPLTSESCCKLISELVKYILYQKQQIPLTYEYLLRMNDATVGANDRNLTIARTTLECLQNISDNLYVELCRGSNFVREIVISMGATMLSPKLCIRVSLPLGILDGRCHLTQQHSSRKPLLSLMKSITESADFQNAMTMPLGLTNTFILLQKNDCNSVSEFFLPKPRYTMPIGALGSRFHIKLNHQDQYTNNCSCDNLIKVYHDQDSSSSNLGAGRTIPEVEKVTTSIEPSKTKAYQWFQSRAVIKGFKFSR
ncbi:MAD2L1-binding protein-like [Athalia rosae]|uniref:MAD2L1-binding protein-like n=1 Tax=Athalia rosae TaxID=37344 RepID=UPI002033AC4E|nr:MAD2L1-binding protein-like [Athalia rosae]